MSTRENLAWIFDNAIVKNYLAYAHGLVGILVVAMLGIGVVATSILLIWFKLGLPFGF